MIPYEKKCSLAFVLKMMNKCTTFRGLSKICMIVYPMAHLKIRKYNFSASNSMELLSSYFYQIDVNLVIYHKFTWSSTGVCVRTAAAFIYIIDLLNTT